MMSGAGNGEIDRVSGEEDHSTLLIPDRYAYRAADAVNAFRNDLPRIDNVITSYTVKAEEKALTLDIPAPVDFEALIRVGSEKKAHIWLLLIIPVVLTVCGVCVFYRQKKTKE